MEAGLIRAPGNRFQSMDNEEAKSDITSGANPAASNIFDEAEAYWLSAITLQQGDVQSDLASLPIRNLYCHAIELYLKAYLRAHGHPLGELDSKLKQNFRRIRKLVEGYGLQFAGRDKATIEYFVLTPMAIRAKYSDTPYYSAPATGDLHGLCCTLRESIKSELDIASCSVSRQ
jgi:hypothetical protein